MTSSISPYGTSFQSLPPPQNRRLAEFATFLGDYKVAMTVWDSLRKEGRGGAVGGRLSYPLITRFTISDLIGSSPSSPRAFADSLQLRRGSPSSYTGPRSISIGTVPSFTACCAMGRGYTDARLVINRCREVASVGCWYSVCLLCLTDLFTKIFVDGCRLKSPRLPCCLPMQRI